MEVFLKKRSKNRIDKSVTCMFFFSNYEPVLLHVFCVSPRRQHGQAPNQALLQPQHLRAGQTVSGAAQIADVPSHKRGSRNTRQEAQCTWEWQLCKLRPDVWQHLNPSSSSLRPSFTVTASAPPPPLTFFSFSPFPPALSSSSNHPSFFLYCFRIEKVHVDFTCLIDIRRIWTLTATNLSVPFSFPLLLLFFFFFGQRMICPRSFQTIRLSFHRCNSGVGSDIHLCVYCAWSHLMAFQKAPWNLRVKRDHLNEPLINDPLMRHHVSCSINVFFYQEALAHFHS